MTNMAYYRLIAGSYIVKGGAAKGEEQMECQGVVTHIKLKTQAFEIVPASHPGLKFAVVYKPANVVMALFITRFDAESFIRSSSSPSFHYEIREVAE